MTAALPTRFGIPTLTLTIVDDRLHLLAEIEDHPVRFHETDEGVECDVFGYDDFGREVGVDFGWTEAEYVIVAEWGAELITGVRENEAARMVAAVNEFGALLLDL